MEWTPSCKIRWVERNHVVAEVKAADGSVTYRDSKLEKVLQQLWFTHSGEEEWRDVELVRE